MDEIAEMRDFPTDFREWDNIEGLFEDTPEMNFLREHGYEAENSAYPYGAFD